MSLRHTLKEKERDQASDIHRQAQNQMPLRIETHIEMCEITQTQTDLQTQVNSCNATNWVILADEKVEDHL